MATAIGLLRVSTEEQGASGLGLEAQEAAIRAAAQRLGFALGSIYADSGVSGAAPIEKRLGLLAAVAELRRGDVLLVAKRDRLGRDPILVAMVERLVVRKGARVLSAAGEGTEGEDPTNVLMRRIVDSFAEYERLVIGARTKAALKAKRARGEKTGGASAPFGFAIVEGKRLEVDPTEAAVAARIRDLRAQDLSLARIAARLNAEGFRTKLGKLWKPVQVARVLAA